MLTKQDRKYIDDLFDEKIGVLAIIIQKGFSECVTKTELNEFKSEIEGRFNSVDERFNNIDEQLNTLDNRLYGLEGKVNTMEFKLITTPNNRLDKVEDDIRQIKSKVGLV